MKLFLRQSQAGIALILVMVTIFVLAVLAGAFAYSMKIEMKLARDSQSDDQLEWIGRSGVEYARWILAQQMQINAEPYDSLNQKWAGGPGSMAETNSPLADVQLTGVQLGEHASFDVKIVDEDRKYNVNAADPVILRQAMILAGVSVTESDTIISSIQDWIDANDDPGPNGSESRDYLSLDPPYQAKNGPIDDLSELMLITGITPELYWGPRAGLHPESPVQRSLRNNQDADAMAAHPVGLVDLFCCISEGRINVNTAPATTLQLIPGLDENLAQAIITTRAGPDGVDGTEDDLPFRNVGELINVPGLSRAGVGVLGNYFTIRSSTFTVEVDARLGDLHHKYRALLRRANPRDIQVLLMEAE